MLSGFFPYSSMSTNELPPRLIIVSSSAAASSSSSVCLSVLIIVFVVYYGWMSVSIECCKCYQCYQCNLLLHFRPFRPCRPFRSIRDKVVRPHTSTTRTRAERRRRGAPWVGCSGDRQLYYNTSLSVLERTRLQCRVAHERDRSDLYHRKTTFNTCLL